MALPDSNSPTYNTWESMIQRTTNPNHVQYKNYGGRGIKVCARWKKFENFYKDMGKRPAGKTLDRKNPNKGYCTGNCVWADSSKQARNRRNQDGKKYRGVVKKKRKGGTKYQPQIKKPKTNELIYLGTFDSQRAAARAFDNKYQQMYGSRPNGTKKAYDPDKGVKKGDHILYQTTKGSFRGEVLEIYEKGEFEVVNKMGGLSKVEVKGNQRVAKIAILRSNDKSEMVKTDTEVYVMLKEVAVTGKLVTKFSDIVKEFNDAPEPSFKDIVEDYEETRCEPPFMEIVEDYKEFVEENAQDCDCSFETIVKNFSIVEKEDMNSSSTG